MGAADYSLGIKLEALLRSCSTTNRKTEMEFLLSFRARRARAGLAKFEGKSHYEKCDF